MKLLFGSDPEVFIVNDKGICVPPIHLLINNEITSIGETEDKHRPIFYKDNLVKVIEDGSAMEFNTKPTNNPEEYLEIITHGLDVLRSLVPSKYNISAQPAVKFNLAVFLLDDSLKPMYDYACRFGCDPDLDIYSGKYSKNVDATKIKHRFGGGHLHISGMDLDNMDVITLVKLFDIFIGNAFVLQSTMPLLEKIRQQYYGRPGKIRIQHYSDDVTGIEYRTPSNSWISNINSIKLMFECATKAVENYNKAEELITEYLDTSIHNILNFDKVSAEKVLSKIL